MCVYAAHVYHLGDIKTVTAILIIFLFVVRAKMPGICPRCQKNVYFAEEKMALGKSFHKMCFACGKLRADMFPSCVVLTALYNAANCKKMLDSTNATEHDDELFCRSCYGKKFGPKGYGYGGGGAGVLSMDDGTGYIVPIFTQLLSP